MAHPCIDCGSECYCNGSIDDVIVDKTPITCEGCGCNEMFEDDDYWDRVLEEDSVFESCADCDGHDACVDFGCAIKSGLGHLVKQDPSKMW